MSSSDAACVITGLRKSFGGRTVLDGVDLTVPAGRVVAILGPSGEGKTTLLRCVAGFEDPDAGTVTIRGQVVAGAGRPVPPERRRIGIVPQEGALFPHLDVAGNVGFGLRRTGSRQARAARVAECLDLVGLPGTQRRRPEELSGGQQQRVALARALAPHPDLVLLDEPFSSLDAELRLRVRDEVRAVLAAAGATAMLVTHDREEALAGADLVGVLRAGRVAQCADPVTLYREPVDLAVARAVGDVVELAGRLTGTVVETPLGRLPVTVAPGIGDGPVRVVVRPEQIRPVPGPEGVAARVEERRFVGGSVALGLRVDGHPGVVAARVPVGDDPDGTDVSVVVAGPVAVVAG